MGRQAASYNVSSARGKAINVDFLELPNGPERFPVAYL